jgi:restriction system protein
MKTCYRLMLGRRSVFAADCFADNFIGADYGITEDLTHQLPDEWREFNARFIPVYLAAHPDKSKIAAGLACGFLWTVSKEFQSGDIVLCPDGAGKYRVAEVTGPYFYATGAVLPHRRPVHWFDVVIDRADLSDGLRNSAGSAGTVVNLSRAGHQTEIERLIGSVATPDRGSTNGGIDDPSAFAMEQHLEEFLVANWAQTELGQEYDIYEEDGERVGQQYQTDTGPVDILAVSKDRKRLLVVELKRGRASDKVVGQILRYMGYVKEELAEKDQIVEGAVIALEDDPKIRRALAMTPFISFYRYQIQFRLMRG